MRYAIIENSIVTNIIWKYPTTELPNAVPCGDYPIAIGDTYENGRFYRDGELVLTPEEKLREEMSDMQTALEILGVNP